MSVLDTHRTSIAYGAVTLLTLYTLWRSVSRQREKRRQQIDGETYDIIVDIDGSPEKQEWGLTVATQYEKNMDALGVCVLGDFKVGKTFLINHLCGLNLASVESAHTRGLSFKRPWKPRNQVVWIDTAGHGSPYDIRRETSDERTATENLINELAYRLSDVRIVVVSDCKLRDQEFIFSIHRQIKQEAKPGKDLLLVVHNYSRITDAKLLEQTFTNDVVTRFQLTPVHIPYRLARDTKTVWVDRSDSHPIYHVFLGKEGSPAGNKHNDETYNAIFDLCVDRLGYNICHNFVDELVSLCNNGLLSQHMGCHKQVKVDERGKKIVVDNNLPTPIPEPYAPTLPYY